MPTTQDHAPLEFQIEDLIGNPPSWLLRSGISMIFLTTICLLVAAKFIKYPDKITAMGWITSEYPPIEHLAKQAGVIDTLLVKDQALVEEQAPLAYLKSTASLGHIFQLKKTVEQLAKMETAFHLATIKLPTNLMLGDIQDEFAALELRVKELQLLLGETNMLAKTNNLKKEQQKTEELLELLYREERLSAQEQGLIQKGVERKTTLNKEGLVSDEELEQSKGELIEFRRQHLLLGKGIIANTILQEQLEHETLEISEERDNKVNSLFFLIIEANNKLQQALQEWEDKNVIRALTSGIVSLPQNIGSNTPTIAGSLIAHVIPDNRSNNIYAEILASSSGIGRIGKGEKTILKIDGFPYKEYGVVEAKVGLIAPIPTKNKEGEPIYLIKIPLGQKIMTRYDIQIPFRPKIPLTAEIILNEKSVLDRIFTQFLNLVKNS